MPNMTRLLVPSLCLAGLSQAASIDRVGDQATQLDLYLIADWGGNETEGVYTTPCGMQVTQSMDTMGKPDAVFLMGDNFYDPGVTDVNDPRWDLTYQTMFARDNLANVPFYINSGNHDYNQNVSAQIAYTNVDPTGRWTYPDWYYKQTFLDGRVLLLALDTSALQEKQDWKDDKSKRGPYVDRRSPQYEWIENELKTSTAEIILVNGHYPVFSVGDHGPTSELVNNLIPLLNKYKVNAFLSGHDHVVEHITSEKAPDTDFFLIGMATTPDPLPEDPYSVYPQSYFRLRFIWEYPEDQMGSWAHMRITEGSDGTLQANVDYIDARDNSILYTTSFGSRDLK